MKSIWLKSVVLLVTVVLVSGALCSLDAQQGSEPTATAEDPLLIESPGAFQGSRREKTGV